MKWLIISIITTEPNKQTSRERKRIHQHHCKMRLTNKFAFQMNHKLAVAACWRFVSFFTYLFIFIFIREQNTHSAFLLLLCFFSIETFHAIALYILSYEKVFFDFEWVVDNLWWVQHCVSNLF